MTAEPTRAFEHRLTEVADGVTLHSVTAGPHTENAVFLLQGFPETWHAWEEIMAPLSADRAVVAVEMKGSGDSSKPLLGYDKRTMARELDTLRERLGYRTAQVVGHDIGAMVAYAWAATCRDTVTQLCFLDVPVPGYSGWAKGLADPGLWHFAFHMHRDLPEILISGREYQYVEHFLKDRMYNLGAYSREKTALYAEALAQPGGTRAALEWYRAFPQDARDNAELAQDKLSIPVLALGGDKRWGGRIVPMMQEFADDVRGGAIAECGHWVMEERPEELVKELQSFLTR